jgi:BNR repeat-like domain
MKKTFPMMAGLGIFLFSQAALAQWTPVRRITWTSDDSSVPKIAAYSSTDIQVIWEEATSDYMAVYYKKSLDGGDTWTTGKRITWGLRLFRIPDLAVDSSGNPHVAWYEDAYGHNEIFYKKSPDGGATWAATKRLTWGTSWSRYPDIVIDSSGNPEVVWQDEMSGNWEVYHRKSTDGGNSWTAFQRLTWNAGESENPAMALDPSNSPYLVWSDTTPGPSKIFYKKSVDGGASWSTAKRISWTSGNSVNPDIAADSSGRLHVVWSDSAPGNNEIYYAKSTDGGATWTASQRITWTLGSSGRPVIVVDPSGHLHVVWEDDTPGNNEIYYKKSTDGGVTWTASQRLTWNAGESRWPDIAADPDGNLHVVWFDDTPGNREIFYRKFNK